jgi:hypothetical protein
MLNRFIIIAIILLLLISFYVKAIILKSDDICIKIVECRFHGRSKQCGLINCNGTLGYECSRFECALNEDSCEEYQQMVRYIDLKKNVKLDKVKTLNNIRGVSFGTRKLRKLERIRNNINVCSLK